MIPHAAKYCSTYFPKSRTLSSVTATNPPKQEILLWQGHLVHRAHPEFAHSSNNVSSSCLALHQSKIASGYHIEFLSVWDSSSVFPSLSWPWPFLKSTDLSLGFSSENLGMFFMPRLRPCILTGKAQKWGYGAFRQEAPGQLFVPPWWVLSYLSGQGRVYRQLTTYPSVADKYFLTTEYGWGDISALAFVSAFINNPCNGCPTGIICCHHSFPICLLTS